MRRRNIVLIVAIVLLAVAIWMVQPANPGIKIGNFSRTMKTHLGLDLQGGMQVLLEADVPADQNVDAQALQDAKTILENRSNGLGVNEVLFQVAGTRRIVGEFPGLSNTEEVLEILKQTGQLEFVDFGTNFLPEGTEVITSLNPEKALTATPVATSSTAPTQVTATPTSDSTTATPEATPTIWNTVMTGKDLKLVSVTTDQMNQYVVSFELSPEGAVIFSDFTSQNRGKVLGIVLDKKVVSSPRIESAITDGKGVISGNFTSESANALAIQLRYGSLPIPLKVVESRIIGPTLGADSLNKSLIAGLVGFILVALFMLIYYRLPGAVAVLAILYYGLITFALYKLIPVTLTLPGIAGLLLSTGGALDANILLFERMKEELREGRNVKIALDVAWRRAWPSIRDSNIATIITSVILFWFGSTYGASIVKGFALTLALGVAISILNATFITRTLLSYALDLFKVNDKAKWFGI